MKKLILTSTMLFSCLTAFAQSKIDLNVDFMVRGYLYAASAMDDTLALGGFGGSDNIPKPLNNPSAFSQTGFFLMIDTTKQTTFADRFNGFKLFLVNKTDTTLKLDASDSRLNIRAEALVGNEWQAIEYLPSSWCGNSYHHVYLKSDQYWEFAIPKYNGKIKTKIRYKLVISKDSYIHTNEITGAINKQQLSNKQGHISQGIMDPNVD